MIGFARRVAELTGVPPDRLERLAGGELSEVLLMRRPDGRLSVAKSSPAAGAEAAMLRALAGAGIPTPAVEGEHPPVLILEHVANDGVLSPKAWREIGAALARLHAVRGEGYGWPVDYAIGTVELDNRVSGDWPRFWAEQRLVSAARLLDRPWRERVDRAAARMADLLPAAPPPALLHGDLWTGNILVRDGRLAALIDPACYHGDPEFDLAMLTLFAEPPAEFHEAYGAPRQGAEERRPAYQLFPALVHLRLFGQPYAAMADRLLGALGA
ncbi:MAG: fructosamine kinase family protein [Allosphingosinicella sp.]|uniref:fructosamine kinase family protein n=1 Tax=Allosphingosinicella sp. TaxID=2823234 RepID=UPI0039500ED8